MPAREKERRWDRALSAWTDQLGASAVERAPEALHAAQTATFATRQRVRAILKPRSVAEVQAAVVIAGRHGLPLYPVSGGKNWGYGSRVPVTSESALLDLGRLNKIRALNEPMAYARVEAGVSQGQLVEAIARKGLRLWVDTTTSSPHASLIGNAVERGHGLTPYADHAAQVCNLEVVLPSGELLRTGNGRFDARTADLDGFGLGPALDGLFFQSNLGVVTAATLWLMPAPEYTEVAFFQIADARALVRAVDALRKLRLDRVLGPGLQLSNVYRGLQRQGAFPWARTRGRTPLAEPLARQLGREKGLAAWSGVAGLHGTRRQVAAARAQVERALRGSCSALDFASPAQLAQDSSPRAAARRRLVSFLTGGLDGPGLGRAYWRKPSRPATEAEMDLDRDRCGVLWVAPLVPFEGRAP